MTDVAKTEITTQINSIKQQIRDVKEQARTELYFGHDLDKRLIRSGMFEELNGVLRHLDYVAEAIEKYARDMED